MAALAGRLSVDARQLADQFPPPDKDALLRRLAKRERNRWRNTWAFRAAGLLLAVTVGTVGWQLTATRPAIAPAEMGSLAATTQLYAYMDLDQRALATAALPTSATTDGGTEASVKVFNELSDSEREGLLDLWEHEPLLASHVSL
jgi:hypothetical protein